MAFWLLLSTLFLPLNSLSAGQFGDFTFTDDGTSITITGYPNDATVLSIGLLFR